MVLALISGIRNLINGHMIDYVDENKDQQGKVKFNNSIPKNNPGTQDHQQGASRTPCKNSMGNKGKALDRVLL
jgi:hypothetical protein